MSARNRSPLGFGPIVLFHLCVLTGGVCLQNLASASPLLVGIVAGAVGVLAIAGAIAYRRFLWDLFRSFRSAVVLLSLLVLSCVMGTLFIQDLDLRRAGVFASEGDERLADGSPPPFDDRTQAGRFAIAQSALLVRILPYEERARLHAEKVRLTRHQEAQIGLLRKTFGDRAADAHKDALLAGKTREVDQMTVGAFARRHFHALYRLFETVRAVHLFDIFEAWWFYALLGLIGINVIVGTITRAPWSVVDLGIAITHAGILIILAGALLDRIAAKEGYMRFVYGDPQQQTLDRIYDEKTRTYTYLPFAVHLENFRTEYYHELFVRRIDATRNQEGAPWDPEDVGGTPLHVFDQIPIRAGVPLAFEGGSVKVSVLDYKPRVQVSTLVEERADGSLEPAIKLGLYNVETGGTDFLVHGGDDPWLFARDRELHAREFFALRFEYLWAEDEAAYRRVLAEPPLPDNGTLVLRTEDGTVSLPVVLGTSRRVVSGTRTVAVEFLEIGSAIDTKENVNLDRKLQRREVPELRLRVDNVAVNVPRDDVEFISRFDALPGLALRFDWPDPKESGVRRVYRVVEGEGLERRLVQIDPGSGQARVDPMPPGKRLALLGLGGFLAVEQAVRSASVSRVVQEISDAEFLGAEGGEGDDLLAAWCRLRVEGPWGTVEREMTPYDAPIHYGPQGTRYARYEFRLVRTGQERDWFSVLTAVDARGNVLARHSAQVNSPLRFGGYRLFQATAGSDERGLGVSGISVTYQPGVHYMYVGYLVLTFGVCYIFFVKPILVRRRRRRRGGAEAAA